MPLSYTEAEFKRVENELEGLKIAYQALENSAQKKTDELSQCNLLLHEEIAERKKIETEILEITQAEQRRFGSQLHDGLCQELTAILVFAKSLAKRMEKDKTLALEELNKISKMLLDAVDQARETARGLYPGELEGASLMNSLDELAHHTLGAVCVFRCPEPILIDDNGVATHLYRIAQEGISNAVKHGKAKNIELSFVHEGDSMLLRIQDDGIGIHENSHNEKGIGLKVMTYRAKMMGASFEVKANTPQGVILECRLKRP